MIVDFILDRQAGVEYNAREFYNYVSGWQGLGDNIARALDGGTNEDVQRELCAYIDAQGYNHEIKKYINSVDWIQEEQHKKTLKECAEAFEESGEIVTVGGFSSFADFVSYFNMHYRPILKKVQDDYRLSDEENKLLHFFADDMLEAFAED